MKKLHVVSLLLLIGAFVASESNATCASSKQSCCLSDRLDRIDDALACESATSIAQCDLKTSGYTINIPGVYCVSENLSLAGCTASIITINASNVVLNLNQQVLDGGLHGVLVNPNLSNVTVYNGFVKNSCSEGILVSGGNADVVLTQLSFNNCGVINQTFELALGSSLLGALPVENVTVSDVNISNGLSGLSSVNVIDGQFVRITANDLVSNLNSAFAIGFNFKINTNIHVADCLVSNITTPNSLASLSAAAAYSLGTVTNAVFDNCHASDIITSGIPHLISTATVGSYGSFGFTTLLDELFTSGATPGSTNLIFNNCSVQDVVATGTNWPACNPNPPHQCTPVPVAHGFTVAGTDIAFTYCTAQNIINERSFDADGFAASTLQSWVNVAFRNCTASQVQTLLLDFDAPNGNQVGSASGFNAGTSGSNNLLFEDCLTQLITTSGVTTDLFSPLGFSVASGYNLLFASDTKVRNCAAIGVFGFRHSVFLVTFPASITGFSSLGSVVFENCNAIDVHNVDTFSPGIGFSATGVGLGINSFINCVAERADTGLAATVEVGEEIVLFQNCLAAHSGFNGFDLSAPNGVVLATLDGCFAVGSANIGFNSGATSFGSAAIFDGCVAQDSGLEGFVNTATGTLFTHCSAENSGSDGFFNEAGADNSVFDSCSAIKNVNYGFVDLTTDATFVDNRAIDNGTGYSPSVLNQTAVGDPVIYGGNFFTP